MVIKGSMETVSVDRTSLKTKWTLGKYFLFNHCSWGQEWAFTLFIVEVSFCSPSLAITASCQANFCHWEILRAWSITKQITSFTGRRWTLAAHCAKSFSVFSITAKPKLHHHCWSIWFLTFLRCWFVVSSSSKGGVHPGVTKDDVAWKVTSPFSSPAR